MLSIRYARHHSVHGERTDAQGLSRLGRRHNFGYRRFIVDRANLNAQQIDFSVIDHVRCLQLTKRLRSSFRLPMRAKNQFRALESGVNKRVHPTWRLLHLEFER